MESLTIMIPAYNEEENIGDELDKVTKYLIDKEIDWKILVVNDGSKDRTHLIVKEFSERNSKVNLINHSVNQGVGTAIYTALENSNTDWAFLHPADGQFDICELDNFWANKRNADIIVGYKKMAHKGIHRRILTNINLFLTDIFFKLHLKNVSWVTLYRMDKVRSFKLEMRSPIISTEILVKAKRNGARIIEIETNVWDRQGGKPTAASIKQILKSIRELLKLKMLTGGRRI